MIEAVTYRLSDHTTADDASRYRDDAEVSRHWPAEPVARLRSYLTRAKLWDKDKEEALLHECGQSVDRAADGVSRDAAAAADCDVRPDLRGSPGRPCRTERGGETAQASGAA